MKWLAIILIVSACSGQLKSDIVTEGGLDILLLECFGWCRLSTGERDGTLASNRDSNRAVDQ